MYVISTRHELRDCGCDPFCGHGISMRDNLKTIPTSGTNLVCSVLMKGQHVKEDEKCMQSSKYGR
jgi:hypothetical protein